jgi:hypothetical protein
VKYENRISRAQQTFLLRLRDGTLTLGELKELLSVKEKQYMRWLRSPFFRAEQATVLVQCSRRRFVDLDLAANVAVEIMRRGMKGELELSFKEIYLCKTLAELAQREHELRRRQARRRKKKLAIDRDRSLCHPSVKEKRGEMLRRLKELK